MDTVFTADPSNDPATSTAIGSALVTDGARSPPPPPVAVLRLQPGRRQASTRHACAVWPGAAAQLSLDGGTRLPIAEPAAAAAAVAAVVPPQTARPACSVPWCTACRAAHHPASCRSCEWRGVVWRGGRSDSRAQLQKLRQRRPRADLPLPSTERPQLLLLLLTPCCRFYMPGIDGTGLAAYRQFPSLGQQFDLRCLVVPAADRTPFEELADMVAVSGALPLLLLLLLGHSTISSRRSRSIKFLLLPLAPQLWACSQQPARQTPPDTSLTPPRRPLRPRRRRPKSARRWPPTATAARCTCWASRSAACCAWRWRPSWATLLTAWSWSTPPPALPTASGPPWAPCCPPCLLTCTSCCPLCSAR
jgi:hypothetical protein